MIEWALPFEAFNDEKIRSVLTARASELGTGAATACPVAMDYLHRGFGFSSRTTHVGSSAGRNHSSQPHFADITHNRCGFRELFTGGHCDEPDGHSHQYQEDDISRPK
jgi:hypothetical protein